METTGSPNISVFDFTVRWDLSGVDPAIRITNASTASNIAACKFWFECYLPDGTSFHAGTLSSPDKIGAWSTIDIAEQIPEILNHIPWGTPFRVRGYVNDGTDTFGPVEITQEICRPNGNLVDTENNFGVSEIYAELRCNDSPKKLYVEDLTNTAYKGVVGSIVSKTYKLFFPSDANNDVDSSESTDTGSAVLLAIGEDSDCYQLIVESIYDYVFDNSTVRIKYKYKKRLEVFCTISLCGLQCSLKKFEDRIQRSGCTAGDLATLTLVNSKYNRLLSGILQPACGVGVPALIAEIQALLPKDCGCS
jgi:hypothetical protein